MRLEKWYADCVIDGEVRIDYLATLCVGPLRLGYRGQLGPGRSARVRMGRRGFAMPGVEDGRLGWPLEEGGMRYWDNVQQRPLPLWHAAHASVVWDPLVLNAPVADSAGRRTGRGYAERLTLDLPPWQLGMDRLKWGRFCGESHSLVWIEWEGRTPLKLCLLDGRPDGLIRAARTEVHSTSARLRITPHQEIARETLGTGALKALGPLRHLAAGRFLSGMETKWLARGVLESGGGAIDQGWVIHEEVVWR